MCVCLSPTHSRSSHHAHTHTHYGFVEQVETKSPVVFKSDAWPSVFMLLLALSNGYLGNLCMEYGPQ